MIFGSCLNGFRTVKLLQDHDSSQMMGERHGAHGKLEIRFFFHRRRHAE